MVITKHNGRLTLTVRGPETKPTAADGLDDAEHFGIRFKTGAFMPHLPAGMVMDRRDLNLPDASNRSFWLHGSVWQFPDFENVDTFVDRLAHEGLLVIDPVVEDILHGQPVNLSLRTAQRRFLQATGLTQGGYFQIERARQAINLLKQGVSILDTVAQAGYSDQPHLTRSLKQFTGQTPSQIVRENSREPLSFLFKTKTF
jgi:AraC-like DNA-binding protein